MLSVPMAQVFKKVLVDVALPSKTFLSERLQWLRSYTDWHLREVASKHNGHCAYLTLFGEALLRSDFPIADFVSTCESELSLSISVRVAAKSLADAPDVLRSILTSCSVDCLTVGIGSDLAQTEVMGIREKIVDISSVWQGRKLVFSGPWNSLSKLGLWEIEALRSLGFEIQPDDFMVPFSFAAVRPCSLYSCLLVEPTGCVYPCEGLVGLRGLELSCIERPWVPECIESFRLSWGELLDHGPDLRNVPAVSLSSQYLGRRDLPRQCLLHRAVLEGRVATSDGSVQ